MARLRDWVELSRATLQTVQARDVADLYDLEWTEARKRLLEEHEESIGKQRGRIRRFIRTCSALMYGLVKRLSPQRRILFALAQAVGILSLIYLTLFAPNSVTSMKTIASLAVAFGIVTALLAMELIDKIKFRDELELARDLQADLLPTEMPKVPGFEIAAVNRIANTVGGDIYDFVELQDGRLAVLFGDASGHGMAAGLVMAVAHASFRTQLDIDPSPAAIMSALNRILCRTGGSRSFFSACYVLIERDGRFVSSLAGHPQALLISRSGIARRRLGQGCYPLGIKDRVNWEFENDVLGRGERLVLHSDGLVESTEQSGRQFGYEYLETVIEWHCADDASTMCQGIIDEWKGFVGRCPIDDDVSLAVIGRS